MNIDEAIVLAGGLGTRLRAAVPDLPKCMAPVAGKPFVGHIIEYLRRQGITRFVFALGHGHEVCEAYLREAWPGASMIASVEPRPLGTGGAIRLACDRATSQDVLVVNGDTMFEIDVAAVSRFHRDARADCTVCLKPMIDIDRYGVVEVDARGRISSFKEKQHYDRGLINGGAYALRTAGFLALPLPDVFSFERDYLEKMHSTLHFAGVVQEGYFVDIGIPDDYLRAQRELA